VDRRPRTSSSFPAGALLVELEYAGDGDFRVRLLDAWGAPVELLGVTRGAGEITRAIRIPTAGAYPVDVTKIGEWEIRLSSDEAALQRANLAELGRADGLAARRRASGRWLGLGFAGGPARSSTGTARLRPVTISSASRCRTGPARSGRT
jgi:hypothetical protein